MKLFSTLAVTAIAAVSTALSAAEVIDMSKKEFWAPVKGVEFSEGQIVTKRAMFRSLKPIDIDTAKKYTLSMSVSTGEGKKQSTFLYGISPVAKNGRTCQAHNIQSIPGTFTEVAADAKKGATEIKVKNGAKWSTGSSAVIAINAKEDFSDIPNFTTVNVSVAKKAQDGDVWTLTLRKPLTRDIKAGSFIRQHAMGGYYYFSSRAVRPNQTFNCKTTLTGKVSHGYYSTKGFHPAVNRAYIIILADWNGAGVPYTIKDAKLTIE